MKKIKNIILLLALITTAPIVAQNIEYNLISPSNYKTPDGITTGEGGVHLLSASHQIPLFVKRDNPKGIKTLTATINAKYAKLQNKDGAKALNPNEIINTGAMLTYVAPIAKRWNIVATAGASLNAHTSYIRLQSIALTGGAIFMYNVNKNLNIGIGAIITTTYGEPVVLPTPFITWKKDGKYSVELNMRGVPELTIATQLNEKTRLALQPFKMEQLSALVNIDGDNKLYSQNILKSTMSVTHRLGNNLSLGAEAGYITYRTARVQERSHKAFWRDLFDSDKRFKFSPSATISVSLKYHFK